VAVTAGTRGCVVARTGAPPHLGSEDELIVGWSSRPWRAGGAAWCNDGGHLVAPLLARAAANRPGRRLVLLAARHHLRERQRPVAVTLASSRTQQRTPEADRGFRAASAAAFVATKTRIGRVLHGVADSFGSVGRIDRDATAPACAMPRSPPSLDPRRPTSETCRPPHAGAIRPQAASSAPQPLAQVSASRRLPPCAARRAAADRARREARNRPASEPAVAKSPSGSASNGSLLAVAWDDSRGSARLELGGAFL